MGGERETLVEKPKKTAGAMPIGRLRVHEASGEVHFHDDTAGQKVSVPSFVWFQAWEQLSSRRIKKWRFYDVSRESLLVVRIFMEGNVICCEADIEKAAADSTFQKLHEFSNSR